MIHDAGKNLLLCSQDPIQNCKRMKEERQFKCNLNGKNLLIHRGDIRVKKKCLASRFEGLFEDNDISKLEAK